MNHENNQNSTQNPNKNKDNWYARMHQSPDDTGNKDNAQSQHRLNLSIFFRIWVTVALIVVIAGSVVFDQLFEHVEPTSKQAIEDTLVDTGKLLSSMLSKPLRTGQIYKPSYQNQLDKAFIETNRNFSNQHNGRKFVNKETLNEMSTSFYQKTHSSFRVYVTDNKGVVIYDSLPKNHKTQLDGLPNDKNAEGKDYSQWNDVHLTLHGKYGARSSRSDKKDGATTIMYVAQPIVNDDGALIGIVSVGKPVATILPYINVARQRMMTTSLIIMAVSVLLAGLVAWWLQQSIALVTRYTRSLASTTNKPSFYLGRELNELTDTIEDMKNRLENKSYVTDYVHTLTHELKSPLTAIKASGELLADMDLDEEDRVILSQTINEQSQKLQSLIDRLLLLAKIEQPNFQLTTKPINLMALIQTLINNHQPSIQQRNLHISLYHQDQITDIDSLIEVTADKLIKGDEFWLSQALDNLISNAIHFADTNITIVLKQQDMATHSSDSFKSDSYKNDNVKKQLIIHIFNDGELIPDYAINKVFDRYFSLSHQAKHAVSTNNKGTGLGLTLAKQVIEHHEGSINVSNVDINTIINTDDNINTGNKGQKREINQQGVCLTINVPLGDSC